MKTIYKFNGVEISKRQNSFVRFIEKGINDFVQAYSELNKPHMHSDIRFFSSWFNRQLKGLHEKGLLKEIPYVYRMGNGWVWANPGIRGSKANFECFTLHDAQMELKSEMNKII